MEFKKLKEIINFNPTERIEKGCISKKVSMDKLGTFQKYINSFELEGYTGGMKFKNGDTLLARITPCLENGKTAQVSILEDNEVGFGSTEYIVMRSIEDVSDKDFIYYLAISPEFRNIAIKSMTGTSGRQRVQLDVVKNTEMLLPSYKQQVKIGKLLSVLDNKIRLNNQINDNLFELLENRLEEYQSENLVSVIKFGKIQGGYAFKSKDLIDIKTNNRIIKIKNLNSSIIADMNNTQFVEDEVANLVDNKFKITEGDVTVAMTGAELGKTGIIFGKDNFYLNQRVGLIRGYKEQDEIYLKIIFLSNKFQEILNSKGYGSAQPNISTSDIENIEIQDISEENLKIFYEFANPVYKKILNNAKENKVLEQIRDMLLLKLMNGEINLDKIEI